jgi:hypothetical protein
MKTLMKTLFLTISLTFFGILVFSQPKTKTIDSTKKHVKVDTLKKTKKDTLTFTKKELDKGDVKIIFQESIKPNIFKDILPILTLLLGIFLNRGIDYFKDRKDLKKIGNRWKAELNCLELPINKQVDYLNEFLLEHKKETFKIPDFYMIPSLDCEIFKTLDKADFIKYLEKFNSEDYENSIKLSNKVNSFTTTLKYNFDNLKLKFDEYLSGTSSHTTNLTSNLQELCKAFANYGVLLEKEIQADPINDVRYKPIYDLFESEIIPKMETGDYNIYELEKKFFNPLKSVVADLRLDDKINEIAKYSSNCVSCIKGIKMEKHYLSENLATLIKRYIEYGTQLKEILAELK